MDGIRLPMHDKLTAALRQVLPPKAQINRIVRYGELEAHAATVLVAVPAMNEERRVAACIGALAASARSSGTRVLVVLLVNNTRDATLERAISAARLERVDLLAADVALPKRTAHAGTARGVALDFACRLGSAEAALFSTDADSRVNPSWIPSNLEELSRGAALVGGRVAWNPSDAVSLPERVCQASVAETHYLDLMRRLEWLTDPDPWNPWPHHGAMSGASIATTCRWYRAVGGLPRVPVGEDRAMFERYRAHDLPVVFSDRAIVATSGRATGRAKGGMADTVAERILDPDAPIDVAAEPARDWAARLSCRAQLRLVYRLGSEPTALCEALGLTIADARAIARSPCFGAAWVRTERAPRLRVKRRLRPSQLPLETARLCQLIAVAELTAKPLPSRDAPQADVIASDSS